MTLPHEEADTLNLTREFLLDVLYGKYKPVSKQAKMVAGALLRHYPAKYRVGQLYLALERCKNTSESALTDSKGGL